MAEEEKKKTYTPSEETEKAKADLTYQEGLKPGEYQSTWEGQLQAAMEKILNRDDFHYRLNGDALYQQYKNAAIRDGKAAMRDTVGRAAALTGGYGNSYAVTAGQQAYANQLEKVNDRIPELYRLALDSYNRQGQRLADEYDLLRNADSSDYSRYRDSYDDWQQEFDRRNSIYTDRRDFDYGAYLAQQDQERWQAEFDEDLRRFELEWAAKHPAAKSSGSSGGSGGSGSKKTTASSTGASTGSQYDSVLNKSMSLVSSGSSWNTINGYLNSSVSSKAITSTQKTAIANQVLDAKKKTR